MPKPTFMQSVLRKPTRSYADPNAPSPWADYPSPQQTYREPQSRYTASRDNGVYLGYKESRYAENEAGPSRFRGSASVVSDMSVSSRSRFPQPKKAMSTVGTREQGRIGDEREYAASGRNGTGTVKKKKKPRAQLDNESVMSGSIDGSLYPSSPRIKTKKTAPRREVISPQPSEPDFAPPPRLTTGSDRGSSATSSPPVPATPASLPQDDLLTRRQSQRPGPSAIQKAIAAGIIPPISPPGSDWSSEQSRLSSIVERVAEPPNPPEEVRPRRESVSGAAPTPVIPPKSPKRLSVSSVATGRTDETAFYTPRTSMNVDAMAESPTEERASPPPPIQLPVKQEIPSGLAIPALCFQPPTPAPEPEFESSPFYSAPTSPITIETPPRLDSQPSIVVKSPTPSPAPQRVQDAAELADDAQSATGEVGSDEDKVSERRDDLLHQSRSSSFSRPTSIAGSRTPSMAKLTPVKSKSASRSPSVSVFSGDELRPSSRASTSRHTTRNSFDDFVVRRESVIQSEMSFAPEGSIRSGISGYGKGGWAAAHASRSGAATPVSMYMPSGANDGWANFQQPISQPPRKSRFTPLPLSSQPKTFHSIVHGGTPEGSNPSSYSQGSDSSEEDDTMPRPSRSYRNTDYAEERGYSPSQSGTAQESIPAVDDRFYGSLQQRQMSLGPTIDPYARRGSRPSSLASSVPPPMPKDYSSNNGSVASKRFSLSPSMRQGQFNGRPVSPTPSRPSSRMGFEPPSFLNPDTLTLLPEMSLEDSAKTYVPSETAKPSRRATSVFGGRSRSGRSEAGFDDGERDSVGDLPRRAKSALGHRDDLSRWEGTSVGEGVLLESHGRDESVKGYSNLILPTGAFKPSDPIKASPSLDLRILGMPHAAMAAIVLSTLPHRDTPIHLRDQTPPIDFSSQLKPPTKVGNAQMLIQVYATAIDEVDIRALDTKSRGDIGKWVPGRCFVGRCMTVGPDEKDIVRGDIVVGVVELKKSGALTEYIVCDRRRLARAPHPTNLSLEQLALLPQHGIAAARAVRTNLNRGARALIMGAHQGVPALICQEMSRAGVHVTAVISGGDGAFAQNSCMSNGARGVLTGSPAGIMLGLDEDGWDFVLDIQGGQRVYDAAKRMLKPNATLVTLVDPALNPISTTPVHARTSGFKTLKAAFGSRKKEAKVINFEYIPPTASGEPPVDSSGLDCRDILEESCMSMFRPVIDPVEIVPLDKGMEVFKRKNGGVVRLVN